MISVDEAREVILSKVKRLSTEEVPILNSLSRVLDEDIISESDIPPFDNSSMDGYAVRSEDTAGAWPAGPVELRVIGSLAAGYVPESSIGKGEAVRIMTGAQMPEGADAVVMIENTEKTSGGILIFAPVKPGENVRFAGEDVQAGEVALRRGKKITPGDIGMIASAGKAKVKVVKRPKVAIITNGDELIEIDEPPAPGKIRNSNAYSIAAQVIDTGCIPLMVGIARDTQEDLMAKFRQAIEESADMIITTGGTSVGDYDFVKDVIKQEGEVFFWQVDMKPGRPLVFGIIKEIPVIGLPGHPASSMVSFEQFARPALLKMSGRTDIARMTVEAVFQGPLFVNRTGRHNMLRVVVTKEDGVFKARLSGLLQSGGLKAMTLANGLMVVPKDVEEIKAGDKVTVQLFEPIMG